MTNLELIEEFIRRSEMASSNVPRVDYNTDKKTFSIGNLTREDVALLLFARAQRIQILDLMRQGLHAI